MYTIYVRMYIHIMINVRTYNIVQTYVHKYVHKCTCIRMYVYMYWLRTRVLMNNSRHFVVWNIASTYVPHVAKNGVVTIGSTCCTFSAKIRQRMMYVGRKQGVLTNYQVCV